MKGIKNILIIIITILLAYSCANDVLDTKPLDKYSEEIVWSDVNLAQGFVYAAQDEAMKEYLMNPEGNANFLGAANDIHADNMARTGGGGDVNMDLIDKFYNAGWGSPTNKSEETFGIIRRCNLILEKISENTSFTEKQKAELIGQGYFLRALVYFKKAKLFGKYIIVDKVLTQDDELMLPRSETIKETYDFILGDLTKAAEGLPVNAPAGSITKGAALALKAEVALHGAAYIESGKEEYYQISKKASEDLFALGNYSLDSNYEGMFNTYSGGLGSPEIILAHYRHGDITQFKRTMMQHLVPNVDPTQNFDWVQPALTEGLEGWQRYCPTAELVNDYLVVDEDGKAKYWNETSYYNNWETNGGYVSNAIYKNRDLRFYASVVHDSSMYFSTLVTLRVKGNLHWSSNKKATWGMTCTGYNQRKGVYEAKHLFANDYTDHHIVLFRLGRSYLNYAEVMLRLNQPAKAIEYINMTRVAHGGLPELSTGLSIDDAWKWFKIERRVELFFEADRYWSLLRWGKEDGNIIIPELNTNKEACEISEDGNSFQWVCIPNGYATRNQMNFSVKRYLFPVPEKERQLNPNLDQNPGW